MREPSKTLNLSDAEVEALDTAPATSRSRLQRDDLGRVGRRERLWVGLYAIALAALTSVPYLVGWSRDTPTSQFSQTLVFERDFNSYCSYVRQSAEGAWLFRNQFTPERHEPAFFNLEFLAAGKLAALFGLSAGAALQVQRAVGAALLVLAVHWISSLLLATAALRWGAVLVITTAGGLGWLVQLPLVGPLLRSSLPVDLYAGLHPFFWMLLHPHFLAAQLLSVLALRFFLKGEARSSRRSYLLSGLAAAACGFIRPYDMLHLQAVSVVYFLAMLLIRSDQPLRETWPRLLLALVPAPVLLYQICLFRFHPIFEWWGRQGVLPPPSIASLLLGMGWPLGLLVAAAWSSLSSGGPHRTRLFLGCCVLCGMGLLYSYPVLKFSFQLVTTLMVPVVLFGAVSLEKWLAPRFQRGRAFGAVAVALLLLNAGTSLLLYTQKLSEVRLGRHRIDGESLAIFGWLRDHSSPGDVVMAASRTSNRIPRFTPASVVAGYRFSTVRFEEKDRQQQRFFDARTRDVSRRRMIKQYGVRYVVYGLEERSLGYDPASSPFLVEAFRLGEAAVYETRFP